MKRRLYTYPCAHWRALLNLFPILLHTRPVFYVLASLVILLAGEASLHISSVPITRSGQYPNWVGSQVSQQSLFLAGEVERHTVRIDYLGRTNGKQTITHPGASFIKVHFQVLDLHPGDYVTISDPAGVEKYTYPGSASTSDGEEGLWSLSITGDTVVIELHSQPSLVLTGSRLGVVIDKYGWGYPQDSAESMVARSTCGANDERRDVVCYRESHSNEFEASNAVARLLVYHPNGYYGFCTAWRVGPGATMLTNQHCLPSQTEVAGAEVWFNYQSQACGSTSVAEITKVTGDRLLTADPILDFSLFTVKSPDSIADFGFLEIEARVPVLGEQVYIPQHAGGGPKQFGIESDLNTGNVCRIDAPILDGLDSATDAGYYCDTTGGSSGAPVVASSTHKVIALHHFGSPFTPSCTTPNQGVRMDLIWPHIEPYLLQVSPFRSIDGYRPVYQWKRASNATWYYLWVEGPRGNVIKQWYVAATICDEEVCSVSPDVTMYGGLHTWWIQTWSNAGYGPWSQGLRFTVPTAPAPGKAMQVSPMGSLETNAPTYTWREVEEVTWYYLWVNGTNGNVIKQWYTAAQANCNGITCSVTPTTTLTSGSHTWWVRAWNNAGYGAWSEALEFEVALPGRVTLLLPDGQEESLTTRFTWQPAAGATWYYLWVDGPSGTFFRQWYTALQAGCNGETCSVTPDVDWNNGQYTWWIRAWSPVGYGPWSEGMRFLVFR